MQHRRGGRALGRSATQRLRVLDSMDENGTEFIDKVCMYDIYICMIYIYIYIHT